MCASFIACVDPWFNVVDAAGSLKAGDAIDSAGSGISYSNSNMNGVAWSVSDGADEGDNGNNLIHSRAADDDSAPWIPPWSELSLTVRCVYATGSDGDESLQLRVRVGGTTVDGPVAGSTGGVETAYSFGVSAGQLPDGTGTQRIEVEVVGATGLVAIAFLWVEIDNAATGLRTSILNQEGGGTLADYNALLDADPGWLTGQFERIIAAQGEASPRLALFVRYGGNEYAATFEAEAAYEAERDAFEVRADAAWLAAGGVTTGNLLYVYSGYHPRTAPDHSFRFARARHSERNPSRVCNFEPTDEWPTVADFAPLNPYDNGGVGGPVENAHLVLSGYEAEMDAMRSHAAAAEEPGPMTTEDLTMFVESGAGAPAFSVLPSGVSMTALNMGLDVKLARDYGAAHFGAEFVHQLTLNVAAIAQSFVAWSVSTGAFNRTELLLDDTVFVDAAASGAGFTLSLRERILANNNDTSAVLDLDTEYYLTVTRSGAAVSLVVRTGSHTGTVVDTVAVTTDAGATFSHLIAAATRGASSGNVTATIGAPDINEAPATETPIPVVRQRLVARPGRGVY